MKPALPISPHLLKAHEDKLKPLYDRFIRDQSLHPSILFTGLEGVGKKSTVLSLIHYIFCDRSIFANQKPEDEESMSLFGDSPTPPPVIATEHTGPIRFTPCEECKSCKRAQANQWLDLFWFEPETNEDGTRVGIHKVDTFRELKGKLGMGPIEEPYKIAVITEAERMNAQAANSILKTLEEPPKNWVFILTAADSSRLLPTILSRCIEIRLNPLSPTQIFNVIKETKGLEVASQRSMVASRAAQGSLTRALQFLDDETWKVRDLILGLFTHPTQDWMRLVDQLSLSQRDLILGLDLIESFYSDFLQYKIVGPSYEWIHSDQKEFLIQWLENKKLSEAKMIDVLSATAEKRKLSTLTLNSKLLAQDVLIPILESIID